MQWYLTANTEDCEVGVCAPERSLRWHILEKVQTSEEGSLAHISREYKLFEDAEYAMAGWTVADGRGHMGDSKRSQRYDIWVKVPEHL